MLKNFMALLSVAKVAEGAPTYGYEKNGNDWGDIAGYEACKGTNQSPIDLISYDNEKFDYKVYNGKDDDLVKKYANQMG